MPEQDIGEIAVHPGASTEATEHPAADKRLRNRFLQKVREFAGRKEGKERPVVESKYLPDGTFVLRAREGEREIVYNSSSPYRFILEGERKGELVEIPFSGKAPAIRITDNKEGKTIFLVRDKNEGIFTVSIIQPGFPFREVISQFGQILPNSHITPEAASALLRESSKEFKRLTHVLGVNHHASEAVKAVTKGLSPKVKT